MTMISPFVQIDSYGKLIEFFLTAMNGKEPDFELLKELGFLDDMPEFSDLIMAFKSAFEQNMALDVGDYVNIWVSQDKIGSQPALCYTSQVESLENEPYLDPEVTATRLYPDGSGVIIHYDVTTERICIGGTDFNYPS